MKKTKEETGFWHHVLGCSCRTAKKTSQSSSVQSSLDGKSKEAVSRYEKRTMIEVTLWYNRMHGPKQTYESFTFQHLMGFWRDLIYNFAAVSPLDRKKIIGVARFATAIILTFFLFSKAFIGFPSYLRSISHSTPFFQIYASYDNLLHSRLYCSQATLLQRCVTTLKTAV